MRPMGFSTGAIAKGDFRRALDAMAPLGLPAVELSALRLQELPDLAEAIDGLNLAGYRHISVHAPSDFLVSDERHVVSLLKGFADRGWPIVVHPDVIFTDALWIEFGGKLLIENSDRRKSVGRTAIELQLLFARFPNAGLCFDIGHARQVDPTMNEAFSILQVGQVKLRQIHISEVNSFSRHEPLSYGAIEASRRVADLVPDHVPIILETLIDQGQSTMAEELARASEALPSLLSVEV